MSQLLNVRHRKLTNPGTRVSLVEHFAPRHIYSVSIDYLVSNIQDVLQKVSFHNVMYKIGLAYFAGDSFRFFDFIIGVDVKSLSIWSREPASSV